MGKILIALYLELIGFCGISTMSFQEVDTIKHAGGFRWSLHKISWSHGFREINWYA